MSTPSKINERIAGLKGLMKREKLAAYIISSSDPHQSEYVCEYWKAREWMSGFTGSAGTLVVTPKQAVLWTDSRYFLQAEMELKHTSIVLFNAVSDDHVYYLDWLADSLSPDERVGCDGRQFSINQIERMQPVLAEAGLELDDQQDLVSELWKNRPILPETPVFEFSVDFAGESRRQKLDRIRATMKKLEADVHLVSSLDSIAWTLNLRGRDVDCNPVFISFLWIEQEKAVLFVKEKKVPDLIQKHLKQDGIQLMSYKSLSGYVSQLQDQECIWLDPANTSMRILDWLNEQEVNVLRSRSIIADLKALKNSVELGHLKKAMIKDGIALTKTKIWLEMILDRVMVTEYELSKQLHRFRQAQGHFMGDSFTAIVGYNANGAIVHYRPKPAESLPMKPSGLLLMDSGGQYLEGTTDITRTFSLGDPTEQQKRHYTLVLKGHIALSNAIFPKGTTGVQLDILARQYLWQRGLNYGHGTGHGVGFFLNVHEGPHSIGADPKSPRTTLPLKPGMIVSNEPGLYLEGQYGIRIENLIVVVETDVKDEKGNAFLGFETYSLFPYELDLIDAPLLSVSEKKWIKDYHQKVFELLKPELSPEEVKWLEKKCQPVR